MSVNLNNPDNITKEISSIKSQLLKIRNIQANSIDELTDEEEEVKSEEEEQPETEPEPQNEILEPTRETELKPQTEPEPNPEPEKAKEPTEKEMTFSKYTKKEIKKYTNAFEVNVEYMIKRHKHTKEIDEEEMDKLKREFNNLYSTLNKKIKRLLSKLTKYGDLNDVDYKKINKSIKKSARKFRDFVLEFEEFDEPEISSSSNSNSDSD